MVPAQFSGWINNHVFTEREGGIMITIDTEQSYTWRGNVYYPAYVNGILMYVFVKHDLDYALDRCTEMESQELIPIPTEKTSMAELEEAVSRKGFLKALWSDLWGKADGNN